MTNGHEAIENAQDSMLTKSDNPADYWKQLAPDEWEYLFRNVRMLVPMLDEAAEQTDMSREELYEALYLGGAAFGYELALQHNKQEAEDG